MADGQLGHVIPLLAQRDEVVVDASLVLASVVEIELLGLHVIFAQLLLFELLDLLEETLFLLNCHSPEDNHAVLEEENLGDVYGRVKVGSHWSLTDHTT